MRIHYLQHVPFEDLGSIAPVLDSRGHQITSTQLYEGKPLPAVSDIDWLIIMGGPMGIYDGDQYPWLASEKQLIREVIQAGKLALGICLGAQLLADALGAKVYRNAHREIGWFDITRLPSANGTILADVLPARAEVFHWHGDTFDIPTGAVPLAESEACRNQGFIFDNRVVAFQFHLETTEHSARLLIDNCRDDLDGSQYVQSESAILSDAERFLQTNRIMTDVLSVLERRR